MHFFENEAVASVIFECRCWALDAHEDQDPPSENCRGLLNFSVARARGYDENVREVHVKFLHP